jgi:alpha-D-ribose 1-methylphosphonate 5-triphosphate synthase subunit PhnI
MHTLADKAIGKVFKASSFLCERMERTVGRLEARAVATQMRLLVDQVIGEAGIFDRERAAEALLRAGGDVADAVIALRAFRQTLETRYHSEVIVTSQMQVLRRISSAFREIPGGQLLGPTRDYTQRLLETELVREDRDQIEDRINEARGLAEGTATLDWVPLPKVASMLQREGILKAVEEQEPKEVTDTVRRPIEFPAPRSAALQVLARGETGALMALGYSAMRGQGGDHPTIGELRYGKVRILLRDRMDRLRSLGRIEVTESENISKIKVKKKDPVPYLSMVYGLCFGHNETKAICMGILDRSMRIPGDGAPAVSQEYVLHHVDGSDASGSLSSLKLPEYAAFASTLNGLREARRRAVASGNAGGRDQL